MWFLILFSFLNAALDNDGFLLKNRLTVAGLPLNLLDALSLLSIVLVVMRLMMPGNRYPAPTHPMLKWTMLFASFGLVAGLIGNSINGGSLYQSVLALRNYVTFPLAVLCGYVLYQTVSSGRAYVLGYLAAGVGCSLLILLFFAGTATEKGADVVVEQIRATAYVSIYAIIAGVFLVYTIIGGLQLWPRLISVPVAALCLIGAIATLGRTEWLCLLVGFVFLPFLLAPGRRAKAIASFTLLVPAFVVALLFGLHLSSQLTGRDMHSKMIDRMLTLIPGLEPDDGRPTSKAWDTRLPGIKRELNLWLKSPLMGQGFAYQTTIREQSESGGAAHQHNAYTSALAGTGPAGLLMYLVPIIGGIVIGRRMVRRNTDRASVLMGAFSAIACVVALAYGGCTMGLNLQRGAIACGLVCGALLRARAIEMALLREYEDYLDPAAAGDGTSLLPFLDQPSPSDGSVMA